MNCPDCNKPMTEVKKAILSERHYKLFKSCSRIVDMYPKSIPPNDNEYRFYCPSCKEEFVYDSQQDLLMEVSKDSQFYYNPKKRLLMFRKD